ncbi:chorismate--pyruvate lyase family protein [Streptomyces sp. NPDC060184]|uniref:chorismate--pyruvate lyase family protein n=1 Tax=Streptomyces sp. NPDC060184 TaxID=3347064 RepID=UPI0036566FD8
MKPADDNPASVCAFDQLGVVGRMLLTTDGTVTTMLEELAGERVNAVAMNHRGAAPRHVLDALMGDGACGAVLTRSTQLVSATTGTVLVYARAVLAPGALPAVDRDLYATSEPIGRLLRRHRVETFRELRTGRPLFDGEIPDPLDECASAAPEHEEPRHVTGAVRTYRIHAGGRPAIFVGEVFTAACLGLGHAPEDALTR